MGKVMTVEVQPLEKGGLTKAFSAKAHVDVMAISGDLHQDFAHLTVLPIADQDYAQNDVHEKAKAAEFESLQLQKSVGSDAVGQLARTGENPENNSKSRESEKKKNQDREYLRLVQFQQWQRQMDRVLGDMKQIVKDMRDNDLKIREAFKILRDKDEHEGRVFLMDKCGKTSEELETKSPKEIFQMVADEADITITQQEKLKQQFINLAEKFDSEINKIDPKFKEEYLQKSLKDLEKIKQEAKAFIGVDYDQALKEARKEVGLENDLLKLGAGNSLDSQQGKQNKIIDASAKDETINELDAAVNDLDKEFGSAPAIKPPAI